MVAGYWSPCATLVCDPVIAPDIRFSSSHFRKQHPLHEKAVIKVQNTDCSMVTINIPPELRKIEQILFASVKQNRFDLVSRIIDGHKCDINVRDSFDRTPLHLAASSGNLPMVKLLIEGRALVDPVDKFGITPLFWAVYNNYKNVAHYLLNMGAKHNRVTKQGFTILHFISESNAISILKYLHRKSLTLEYDVADNSWCFRLDLLTTTIDITLSLQQQQQQYSSQCVALVWNQGFPTPLSGSSISTNPIKAPNIHFSSSQFRRQQLRLEKKNGMTPFLIAASKGNELLMEILVKRNCNVNATDLYGRNALHFVSKNGHIDALYYLLSVELLKTKIDERDYSGCSPLHLACENNQQHCVRLLLETGANPDIETETMTIIMISSNALVLMRTRDCPLIECSRRGFHKCIDLLIENKASREKTSKDKQTPLHLAVSQNRLEAVEALLFCGAPLDLRDKMSSSSYSRLIRWVYLHPRVMFMLKLKHRYLSHCRLKRKTLCLSLNGNINAGMPGHPSNDS
ncbi:unnamed protein product [Schistosoma curassoni]|uniref:ANK_REP_REGION domain-containing protein n=1 Tax=Schistosoma curassoni TaxID=6186 RepID=A0A183JXV6_9TREM|nr:unnamed protein product [Schistosoma curassoni]